MAPFATSVDVVLAALAKYLAAERAARSELRQLLVLAFSPGSHVSWRFGDLVGSGTVVDYSVDLPRGNVWLHVRPDPERYVTKAIVCLNLREVTGSIDVAKEKDKPDEQESTDKA